MRIGPRRSESIRDTLLWAMPFLGLAMKYWIIQHILYHNPRDILDTDTSQFGFFGFGDYIYNLYHSGVFKACRHLPFVPSQSGVCDYSSRMPGLPLLITGLAKIVGTRSVDVALAKTTVMTLLVASFLMVLVRDVRLTWMGLLILYTLYLGPQPLKHGASLEYEEGLLIDLAICLAVCASYVLCTDQTESARRRNAMAIMGVSVAAAMYLIKTTALPMVVLIVAAVVSAKAVGNRTKVTCVAVAILSIAGWGWHNLNHSGVLHLSSSFNGENLLRGNDTGAYRIYPEIYLDRIMDSRHATLDDGTVVPLGDYTDTVRFADEWSWDAHYHDMAYAWMRDNPRTAFAFFLKKVWVTFFEIRQTPVYYSATDKTQERPLAMRMLMDAWMLVARTAMLVLVGRALWEGVRRGQPRKLWIVALVFAPCLPFTIVFAYQRHLVPLLVFSGVLLAIVYCSHARADRGGALRGVR